ncbi:MAG: hypothetical protein GEU82_17455 [Luteitalea sp.]|nr:hypothetical protein [Luteitalea sp.]
MKFLGSSGSALALALVLAAGVGPAGAQNVQSVTSADVQRLQDAIYDTSRDLTGLRGRDSRLATELESELDELRDETVYLRVKVRKGEPIARSEYSSLRDRIDAVRSRARGDAGGRTVPSAGSTNSNTDRNSSPDRSGQSAPKTGSARGSFEVPVGTEFDVRLQNSLSSATAQVEDRFEGTTMVDLHEGDRLLVPAGSIMRGIVSSVTKAGRIERKGSLTVAFDRVTINGRNYPIRATVTQAIESEGVRGEAGKIGTGAGVGAIIGGILGGFKGALAGILIGGGGTIAATEGNDVDLAAGTVLRVRLDSELNLSRDGR